MMIDVIPVASMEEALAVEDKVKARKLSRHVFEIAVSSELADRLEKRPAVEEEESGWSQWGHVRKVNDDCFIMALRWQHNPAYYAKYDNPLTRYDEEREINDLESDENDHAGDW